jgi:hypothetical protein
MTVQIQRGVVSASRSGPSVERSRVGTDSLGDSLFEVENVLGPITGRGIISGDAGPNRHGCSNGEQLSNCEFTHRVRP